MIGGATKRILLLLAAGVCAQPDEQVVVDFEKAVPLGPEQKANRVLRWEENGVVFTLAHEPRQTKGKGLLMFFTHLSTGRIGLVSAMATEPIPVRATFPTPVSSVTVSFWGSSATPAVLEAFDAAGKLLDRASLSSVPARAAPGDPIPTFTLTVQGGPIAWIHFSGPREGEYLAADEVRFTPINSSSK
ncbi:MAG: hypothetical protein SFV54_14245 [Bryobacteraceae bacterium]|nr:hypothetical protein [Bryobacteraceae bacterium]